MPPSSEANSARVMDKSPQIESRSSDPEDALFARAQDQ